MANKRSRAGRSAAVLDLVRKPVGTLRVDHEIPGRIRFRVISDRKPERILDHLSRAVAEVSPSYKLRYNPASRRYLLRGPRSAPLREAVGRALGGKSRIKTVPGPRAQDARDRWVRTRSDGAEPGSVALAAAKLILPEVAWYLIKQPLVPPPLRPILAAHAIAPFIAAGLEDLRRGALSVSVLDASAIIASLAMGDVGTARSIAFMLELGETLEHWTRQRTRASLTALYRGDDPQVWVRREGRESRIPMSAVRKGDLVIVRAGERIAVDGVVVEGVALVDQSSMTGESLPKRRGPRLSVYAGTVVTEGTLVVDARRVGGETRFAHIIRLLERSDGRKAAVTNTAEQLARRAVPWTFGLSAAVAGLSGNWRRGASVLVVDYSCALKLATPLTMKSAVIESASRGAVIKGGRPLEQLARVDAFVLDKTGTLTEAHPRVVDVLPINGFTREFVLRNAACLEEHFQHPVATAVVRAALTEEVHHDELHAEVDYVLAHGIASTLEGDRILVGSRHFVEEDEGIDISCANAQVEALAVQGCSALYVAVGGELAGVIGIEDPLLADAGSVIAKLRDLGAARIVLVTGDNEASAREVAGRLGIDELHSEVLPDDKVRIIEGLQGEGHVVAMVGDGMNDSAALAHADVGISVSHGADVAREACDVLLMEDRLAALPDAVRLARKAMERARVNFGLTIGVNSALIGLGLTGLTPAALLAVLHNTSTLVSCVVAMRPLLEQDTGLATATVPD